MDIELIDWLEPRDGGALRLKTGNRAPDIPCSMDAGWKNTNPGESKRWRGGRPAVGMGLISQEHVLMLEMVAKMTHTGG